MMFYGDIRFCFKLLPGVSIADKSPVYSEIVLTRAKSFDPATYDEKHEGFRVALSQQFECDLALVKKIDGAEYEAHVDLDDSEDEEAEVQG